MASQKIWRHEIRKGNITKCNFIYLCNTFLWLPISCAWLWQLSVKTKTVKKKPTKIKNNVSKINSNQEHSRHLTFNINTTKKWAPGLRVKTAWVLFCQMGNIISCHFSMSGFVKWEMFLSVFYKILTAQSGTCLLQRNSHWDS